MSQPVKLSDELVMEARVAGAAMQRSIAGQVEFWARLGMTLERGLTGGQQVGLLQRVSTEELLERLKNVNQSEGRARLEAYLKAREFPRFWAHPVEARVFIREDADGTKTVGKFKGREFVQLSDPIDGML
jgi:ParD-like antitoxin of type II ParDE toxin-antitoxin system